MEFICNGLKIPITWVKIIHLNFRLLYEMKTFLNKVKLAVAAVPGLLAIPGAVLASNAWDPKTIGFASLDDFIQNTLTVAVVIAALVAVVYLIINGLKYITSAGDSTKTEEAQKGIIAALVGLVVVGIAYLLVSFVVKSVLGVDDLGSLG